MRWLVGIVALSVAFSALAAEPGLLDGTKWKVTVTPDKETAEKGEKAFEDTLLFASGKVMASVCVARGFGPSAYYAERKDDSIKWQTEQVSEIEGKAFWVGAIKGRSISGTVDCTRKDGARRHFAFTGSKE